MDAPVVIPLPLPTIFITPDGFMAPFRPPPPPKKDAYILVIKCVNL